MRRTGHRDHLKPPEHRLEDGAPKLTAQVVLEKQGQAEFLEEAFDEGLYILLRPMVLVPEAQGKAGGLVLDPKHSPSRTHRDEVRRVGDLGRRKLVPPDMRALHSSLRITSLIQHLVDLASGDHSAERLVDRMRAPRAFFSP